MAFVPASPESLLAFEVICASVVAALLFGVHVASRRLGGPAGGRTLAVAVGLAGWLALLSLVVRSGVLEAQPMPRLLMFFAASNLVALGFGLSPVGGWLARGLPLVALLAFQSFRVPLELVLHAWAAKGTVPSTMTWTGANFDIVSGLCAGAAALAALRFPAGRLLPWIANVVGVVLLANVARVAVLSSPLPFSWQVEPPLQLAFHLPYALILPICIGGALAGHVILTRALLASPGSR